MPVKLQKENPTRCAGEAKQSKGNIGKGRFIPSIAFCDEITRIRCEGKGVGGEGGREGGKRCGW